MAISTTSAPRAPVTHAVAVDRLVSGDGAASRGSLEMRADDSGVGEEPVSGLHVLEIAVVDYCCVAGSSIGDTVMVQFRTANLSDTSFGP